MKRNLSLSIMLLIILLLFTACSRKIEIETSVAYVPKTLVSYEESSISSADISGDTLFYYGTINAETQERLYIRKLDGGENSSIRLEDGLFLGLTSAENNSVWCLSMKIAYTDHSPSISHIFYKYNADGNLTDEFSVQLQTKVDSFIGLKYVDGYMYLLYMSNDDYFLDTYDSQKNLVESTTLNGRYSDLVRIGDDVFCVSDESGLGDTFELRTSPHTKFFGTDSGNVYFSENGFLYAYHVKDGTKKEVLNWVKLSIDYQFIQFSDYHDGVFYLLINHLHSNSCEIIAISEEAQQRTVLRLAVLNTNHAYHEVLIKAVAQFNSESDEYFIEMVDYAQKYGDIQSGLTALTVEIISSSPPDMYYLEGMPVETFERQGVFLDLNPFIKADSELSDDEFVGSLFQLLENNGKLYRTVGNFSLSTMIGVKRELSGYNGWSLQEMTEYISQDGINRSPVFGASTGKEGMFKALCSYHMLSLIDTENGLSNFDSALFRNILIFCDTLPAESELPYTIQDTPVLISNGRQRLAVLDGMDNFLKLQIYPEMWGEEFAFIGFPNDFGNGSAFKLENSVAVSSKTDYKDAAWQFARIFLTEEFQNQMYGTGTNGFPTNKKSFDLLMDTLMTQTYHIEEDGSVIGPQTYTRWGDFEVLIRAASPEEIQELKDLIDGIEAIYTDYPEIYSILSEEVQPYFYGGKTIDEAIKSINSRVGLYLSESR